METRKRCGSELRKGAVCPGSAWERCDVSLRDLSQFCGVKKH